MNNMTACNFDVAVLATLIEDFVYGGKVPAEVREHMQACDACRLIFSSPEHARRFLDFRRSIWCENQPVAQNDFCNGQIRRICGYDENLSFALLLGNTTDSIANDELIGVILRPDPLPHQTEADDLIIDSIPALGGMPLLVECWNRREFKSTLLAETLAQIDLEMANRISRHSARLVARNNIVQTFRRHEIENSPGEPFQIHNLVKIEYFVDDSIYLHENFWNPLSTAKLAADTDKDQNENLKFIYEIFCRFIERKALALRVRFSQPNILKIVGQNEDSLSAELWGRDFEKILFSGSNGVLEITSADLVEVDSSQLLKIILKVTSSCSQS